MFSFYLRHDNPAALWVKLMQADCLAVTHNRRRGFFNSLNRMRWQDFAAAFYSDHIAWRVTECRGELLRYSNALRHEGMGELMCYVLTYNTAPYSTGVGAPWDGQEFTLWMD